jgi:hypothetical protein
MLQMQADLEQLVQNDMPLRKKIAWRGLNC